MCVGVLRCGCVCFVAIMREKGGGGRVIYSGHMRVLSSLHRKIQQRHVLQVHTYVLSSFINTYMHMYIHTYIHTYSFSGLVLYPNFKVLFCSRYTTFFSLVFRAVLGP